MDGIASQTGIPENALHHLGNIKRAELLGRFLEDGAEFIGEQAQPNAGDSDHCALRLYTPDDFLEIFPRLMTRHPA